MTNLLLLSALSVKNHKQSLRTRPTKHTFCENHNDFLRKCHQNQKQSVRKKAWEITSEDRIESGWLWACRSFQSVSDAASCINTQQSLRNKTSSE